MSCCAPVKSSVHGHTIHVLVAASIEMLISWKIPMCLPPWLQMFVPVKCLRISFDANLGGNNVILEERTIPLPNGSHVLMTVNFVEGEPSKLP